MTAQYDRLLATYPKYFAADWQVHVDRVPERATRAPFAFMVYVPFVCRLRIIEIAGQTLQQMAQEPSLMNNPRKIPLDWYHRPVS